MAAFYAEPGVRSVLAKRPLVTTEVWMRPRADICKPARHLCFGTSLYRVAWTMNLALLVADLAGTEVCAPSCNSLEGTWICESTAAAAAAAAAAASAAATAAADAAAAAASAAFAAATAAAAAAAAAAA
eukprot:CAMPEP_0172920920 /NCGR_PEP_ID=MMETSP1075-20121228/204979_1 /TAXON_ID=2916 /ORGANISM="Ceratium fusus, Strain PA161109" /LENGTH=128 /DNA_ID=CAMNT_0013781013 /DNA_START=122 /DNA_END=505 /DNA_ORIENTATION=-